MYFPMCGMNVMWKAEATVLMYHMLMGRRVTMLPTGGEDADGLIRLPFDRFGDIWAGIVMKKIADYARLNVATGMPYIRHERASNPFTNLKKEANGIEVNEDFWEFVHNVDLSGDTELREMYHTLGSAIRGAKNNNIPLKSFVETYPKYAEYTEYFKDLGNAMTQWSTLFMTHQEA